MAGGAVTRGWEDMPKRFPKPSIGNPLQVVGIPLGWQLPRLGSHEQPCPLQISLPVFGKPNSGGQIFLFFLCWQTSLARRPLPACPAGEAVPGLEGGSCVSPRPLPACPAGEAVPGLEGGSCVSP